VFRKTFDLFATPVQLEFRTDANPFTEGKRQRRNSSGRPGKATAKNPGSKNRRAAAEKTRKKRKKTRREDARPRSPGNDTRSKRR
jgi:hypothetical protein